MKNDEHCCGSCQEGKDCESELDKNLFLEVDEYGLCINSKHYKKDRELIEQTIELNKKRYGSSQG